MIYEGLAAYEAGIGLAEPWHVTGVRFDSEARKLHIAVAFRRGTRFDCPSCGVAKCPVHDTMEYTWRHLNYFQHEAYLTARVPRVKCANCGVKQVVVPWARLAKGSVRLCRMERQDEGRDGIRLTLEFEAHIMKLVRDTPVATVARQLNEHDTRLWRVIHHYVDEARSRADHSGVTRVGVDETASKRGHNYVSLFVDIDHSTVLFVADGKGADTVAAFAGDLKEHRADPEQVAEVCIDMSPAFIAGVAEHLPAAEVTFDKFHAVKIVNEAVDQVRREEQKNRPELKKTRYAWLKNEDNLSSKQQATIESLASHHLKTSRAYEIRLTFQEFYQQATREEAELFLKKWYYWGTHSKLPPMVEAARTIKRHWDGILRWHDSHIANGILEGLNSLVQAAKAKARGYRSHHNLKAIIYLIAGKLDILVPT